jgi:uncharacterized protein YfdQ (DUF2303 family)
MNEQPAASESVLSSLPQEHLHVDKTVIDRIGNLTRAASAIQLQGNSIHLVMPEDFRHTDITDKVEAANPHPNRKKGTQQLGDIASFNNYVKAHGNAWTTVIYADPEARTLTAVFNDHEKRGEGTPSSLTAPPLAGWRDHRAVYNAELSREFATWFKNNKQVKEQEDFAVFIEDNIADVMEPSGDVLLQIALTLQAKTEVNFSSSKRLDNGQVQLTYTENIDARAGNGNIDIPREFAIGCRLFKNGEGYKVRARLKYRLGGGKVKFWYELDRPENVIEDAFTAYVEKARETTFPVLIGKP